MKIFNGILGVFSIFASIYCIWFPGLSFLKTGWIITILLGAWGFCSIFNAISNHKKDKEGKAGIANGTLALFGGICAAIISILAIFMPRISLIADLIVVYIFVFWLIMNGMSSIVLSVTAGKEAGGSKWIWSLILGIIILISGIYGIFHIIFMAQTIGMLIGFLLMTYGFRLMASIFE